MLGERRIGGTVAGAGDVVNPSRAAQVAARNG